MEDILSKIKNKNLKLNFNAINFLCLNPHCSENNTLGIEDKIIKDTLSSFKEIKGPFAADSAFKTYGYKSIYVYHVKRISSIRLVKCAILMQHRVKAKYYHNLCIQKVQTLVVDFECVIHVFKFFNIKNVYTSICIQTVIFNLINHFFSL